MKLEAGKTYLNREGERVKLKAPDFPFVSVLGYLWFDANGKWEGSETETPLDLIAEAPEESPKFKVGQKLEAK